MNTIEHTPYIRNEKKWYFLSIFYAREKWGELVAEILRFYQERKNQFDACLISFSKEKGEQIQVTFITSEKDNNNYSAEIQFYFQRYIKYKPSMSQISFPYGQAIWCNYLNNSLEWDKNKLPDYSNQYISFHKKTIDLLYQYLEDDFSPDAFLSVGMYMILKGLFCLGEYEQRNTLQQILSIISVNLNENAKEKEKYNVFDIGKVCKTIESYRNENDNECSNELINWMNEFRNYLKIKDYSTLYFFICKIMGLTIIRQLVILNIINKWYKCIC